MKVKTANIGNIDNISHVIDVDIKTNKVDSYSNRLSGKWYKTHHDTDTIWIDGTVSIINNEFVNYIKSEIEDFDIIITRHPQRKNLQEEYDYIIKNLRTDPYLKVRYENEPCDLEIKAFNDSLDAELVNPAFFAIIKNEKTDKLMKEWWDLILEYTIFDQSQITYLLHNNKDLKVKIINWDDLKGFVIKKDHIRLI